MRAFKNRWFNRWARNEGIDDAALCAAAADAAVGHTEAELGGYLFKKRVARPGSGKSGGYRTIIGYRKGNTGRVIFLYGFPKNARSNITAKEHAALSIDADVFIRATDEQVAALLTKGSIFELECP